MVIVVSSACSDSASGTDHATGGGAELPGTSAAGGTVPGGGGQGPPSGQSNGGGTSPGGAGSPPGSGAAGGVSSSDSGGAAAAAGAGAGGAWGSGGVSAASGTGSVGTAGTAGVEQAGGAAAASGRDPGGQAGFVTGGTGQSGGGGGAGGQAGAGGRSIFFGTLLDAQAVVSDARAIAQSLAEPSSPEWRAKGDQRRSYRFAAADADSPYRLYVPTDWDGTSDLPLAMFLHGAGSDENSYLDQNDGQMVKLAEQHGYLLVSPRGHTGAYGNFLRLTAPFGDEAGAAELMAQVTAESELANQLSERDVINVLELVSNEYPVDRESMFLFGHSMGSGGTWYIGGKYVEYWRAIGPMSGPFVQETGYPWESVRDLGILVTEGTQTPSLDASRLLRDWLSEHGFQAEYEEVNADHGGMVTLVLPDIFAFFDRSRSN